MENNLLLLTSTELENSTLIDCMRQSIIDLDENSNGELVEDLLKNALKKLNEKILKDEADELIALILKCFQCMSTNPLPFLSDLFEKSNVNLYAFISFFSVLSYLINNKKNLNLSTYNSFVEKALIEVQLQIQNNDQLILFNYNIPSHLIVDLIYDIILSANITEQLMNIFCYYFFKNDNQKKFSFIQKANELGFGSTLQPLLCKYLQNNKESSNFNDDLQTDITNEKIDDEILSKFLSQSNPETNETLKNALFEKMLNEKSNFIRYLQIIFENLNEPKIEPMLLLEYFNDEYEKSKDDFINTLDNVLVFHPTEKVFIPQPSYKPLNLPHSEFNVKIINTLFSIVKKDPGNFQAFYCLEFIACSFPFIFSSEPKQVFESILPAFDNYKLIFEKKDANIIKEEKKVRKGKAAIAAISFLLFALNSTKVFDSFVSWFFENVKKFSLSQLLCIIIVLIDISTTDLIKYITILFIKNHFFYVFSEILLKEVPNNLFGENFNKNLYMLLNLQHVLSEIFGTFDALTIDANFNRDNIFYEASGKRITHSICVTPSFKSDLIYVPESAQKELNKEPFIFLNETQNLVPTWIIQNRKIKKNISKKTVDDFITKYNFLIKEKPTVATEKVDFQFISNKINVSKALSLFTKENWIIRYMFYDKKFPLLSKHYEILSEAMNSFFTANDDEDGILLDNYRIENSKNYIYICYRESHDFIHNLITRLIKTFCSPIFRLCDYFDQIPFNEFEFDLVLTSIRSNFLYIEQNCPCYVKSTQHAIYNNLTILHHFVQKQIESKAINNSCFTELYFKKIGDYLIDFVLKPQHRIDKNILELNCNLLRSLKKYPVRVLHIIGFMLISDDRNLQKLSTELCFGFDDKQLVNFEKLKDFFRDEVLNFNENSLQISIISNILRSSPSIAKELRKELTDILEKSLEKLQKQNNYEVKDTNNNNDKEIKDFVVHLLDFLSPNRDSVSFSLSDSNNSPKLDGNEENEKFRFHPIPNYIYISCPRFWDIFKKHRLLINQILLEKLELNEMINETEIYGQLQLNSRKNFSSRFVTNYSECFSFDFRSTFFHQIVQDALNFSNEIELKIDPKNILNDSFDQLSKKTVKEWKSIFRVKYKGNIGVDVGGLTKDCFTKLTNEIIDPKQNLFEITTVQDYLPSRSQYAKSPEGLKKFKFMGMITARALLQGIVIPISYAKSFIKQILHHRSRINELELKNVDEDLYKNIEFYKDFDFASNPKFDVRFEVDEDGGKTVELIENGSQIRVNDENKMKYIELMKKYRLIDSIREQTKAFCDGFDSIIEHNKIRMFTQTELCWLICGVPKIDVDDLRKNVKYGGIYNSETPVVKMFFESIKEWDDENLAMLLLFITGMSKMPINGFVFFKQINKQITIIPGGDCNRFPLAHTCTNTLELPQYTSKDDLNEKFLIAIKVDDFQIK